MSGHISRFCHRHAVALAEPKGGVKGKGRATDGSEEKRMGPNERGWQEENRLVQVNAIGFDYSKRIEELVWERGGMDSLAGARA